MDKIGGNVLCSCGSGKKIKQCCGKEKVFSIDRLVDKELYDIHFDILQFALEHYEGEIDGYLNGFFEEFDFSEKVLELCHFFGATWFITSVEMEGKTILKEYIDRHSHNFSRARVRDIVQSWSDARPTVAVVQHQDSNLDITVQDIFTDEVSKVRVLGEEYNVEAGGLIVGTILPAGSESVFFTSFIDLPAEKSSTIKESILTLYKNCGEETSRDFMSLYYLDVLNLCIFEKGEFKIEDIEASDFPWISPMHEEVARNLQEFMEGKGYDDTSVQLGLVFWYKYCERRYPSIKYPNKYVAALVYLVNKILPGDGILSQRILANEFGASKSRVSAIYKEFENVLSPEISDLKNTLKSLELSFDEMVETAHHPQHGFLDMDDFLYKGNFLDGDKPVSEKRNDENENALKKVIFSGKW